MILRAGCMLQAGVKLGSGLILFTGVMFPPLSARAAERLERSASYFGTTVNIVICYPEGGREKALAAAGRVWGELALIHSRMNRFDPASDLSRLNQSAGDTISVDPRIYGLIADSRKYGSLAGGAFDVTVTPLLDLWGAAARRGVLPAREEILEARQNVGVGRVELLEGLKARVPQGMMVDLGGVAAGFAVDEAVRILRGAGFNDFLVDAGGEIYASGRSCDLGRWRIGIRDPRERSRVVHVLELEDMAVSTSGGYEKYFEINGERWPHIINPLTGYPGRGAVSATVIAPRALDADALSTALCVLGEGPGFRIIDGLGTGYAAMVMTENVLGKLEQKATQGYAVFRVK